QVYAVTDRITVLRNGRFVGEFETPKLPRVELIAKMLGRELAASSAAEEATAPNRAKAGEDQLAPVLEAKGISRRGAVRPVDVTIRRGEVVGLAGLLGSGRTETARLLFGIDRRDSGEVTMDGKAADLRSPREAIRLGMAFCSENRKTEGIIPNLSVRENLILAMQASRGTLRLLAPTEQMRLTDHYIRALNLKR